jgi:DNA-directed RNA polymerase subunit E'/Rpb7
MENKKKLTSRLGFVVTEEELHTIKKGSIVGYKDPRGYCRFTFKLVGFQ